MSAFVLRCLPDQRRIAMRMAAAGSGDAVLSSPSATRIPDQDAAAIERSLHAGRLQHGGTGIVLFAADVAPAEGEATPVALSPTCRDRVPPHHTGPKVSSSVIIGSPVRGLTPFALASSIRRSISSMYAFARST